MYNEIRWEECALGKKLYTKENISKAETEWLGIRENAESSGFHQFPRIGTLPDLYTKTG